MALQNIRGLFGSKKKSKIGLVQEREKIEKDDIS